jgi:tRNA-binding protein
MENNLTWQEFERVSMHVGTIVEVKDFPEARKPAYQLTIDFGETIGMKNFGTNYQTLLQG